MDLLKKLQKNIKLHHIIGLVGLVVLVVAFKQYSDRKTLTLDGMTEGDNENSNHQANSGSNPAPANPAGENEVFSSVSGMVTTSQDVATSASTNVNSARPEDLLPKDTNNEWARLNPSSNNDLSQVNLLKAGYHNGVDTIGSSLRNANLQIRSEPPNPTNTVSPWMNT
jgi:hypothetical protein